MKKWMAMLLIVALALVQMGAALAQEMPEGGLTVAIKRAAMRASWQGETADNARWLVVEVTLTNWDGDAHDIADVLTARLVYLDK